MDKLIFKPGPHGHFYATTRDGMEIVRCQSGNSIYVYYKKMRPEIDNTRVRMHWEELCEYNLHRPEGEMNPYSLDQHGNIHWGDDILELKSYDKDGFPVYPQQSEEIIGPGFEDGPTKGLRSFVMPRDAGFN